MRMETARRLREARLHAGYESATAAAHAFGWSPSTYLGHENGSRGLKPAAAQKYARAFGVSWAWLLGAEDNALSDVLDALTPIKVVGVIDPESFRPAGFLPVGTPSEITVQVFGYRTADLEAYVAYGQSMDEQRFVVISPVGALSLLNDDIIVMRRKEGERVEFAAWRMVQREKGVEVRLEYAPHILASPRGLEVFDDPSLVVMGVVVAELRIRKRAAPLEAIKGEQLDLDADAAMRNALT